MNLEQFTIEYEQVVGQTFMPALLFSSNREMLYLVYYVTLRMLIGEITKHFALVSNWKLIKMVMLQAWMVEPAIVFR